MSKTLGELLAENEFTVFVNSRQELKARLETGHRVEYRYKGAYIISQKRGQEYVTVCEHSEDAAKRQWDRIHDQGYYYDWKSNTRHTIPGAR